MAAGQEATQQDDHGAEVDTWHTFRRDVHHLLELYKAGEDCMTWLMSLPSYLESAAMKQPGMTLQTIDAVAEILQWAPTRAEHLVQQETQLWKCAPYPLVVMFEAYSQATGIPCVFYLDCFLAFASSLIHRDVAVHLAGFDTRARYWVAGTAQPGSGKTPALEPFRKALLEVMREHPDLAPGTANDNFHVQEASTHAAAVHRLRCTEGYQIIASSEGGPMLCPTWATSGTWNQGTHINLQRYLNTAYGGAVFWDTMIDRKAARAGKGSSGPDGDEAFIETTNVAILILQQLSVFFRNGGHRRKPNQILALAADSCLHSLVHMRLGQQRCTILT